MFSYLLNELFLMKINLVFVELLNCKFLSCKTQSIHSYQPFRFWRNSSAFYAIFRHSDRNDQIPPKLKKFCNANTIMDKDYACARLCIPLRLIFRCFV